jgi:hypothetical protein
VRYHQTEGDCYAAPRHVRSALRALCRHRHPCDPGSGGSMARRRADGDRVTVLKPIALALAAGGRLHLPSRRLSNTEEYHPTDIQGGLCYPANPR